MPVNRTVCAWVGYSGFQVTAMIKMGAKIKDPKNFPGQFQQNPKKSLALKLTLLYGKMQNYMQKVIILMQNVIKTLMHNVIIFQLKM